MIAVGVFAFWSSHALAKGGAADTDLHRANATLPGDVLALDGVRYGDLPLAFEPNRGQTTEEVRFLARGAGYGIFLTAGESVVTLNSSRKAKPGVSPEDKVVRMRLRDAAPAPRIVPERELPGTSNYFRGDDASRWLSAVPQYGAVRYVDVYPGIDLVYYGRQGVLEYDFVVAPGSRPERIAMEYAGADHVELDAQGNLLLTAGDAKLVHHKPVIYQEIDGQRRRVDGDFELRGNEIGFRIAEYDQGAPLVIDPQLVYSTYLGGAGNDFINGIAIDSGGNTYLMGRTSGGFPTTAGVYQNVLAGGVDAFVTKLNPSGTAVLYSTYLGGSGNDGANSAFTILGQENEAEGGSQIAVDSSGNAYVTGSTVSTNFPTTPGAYQTAFGGVIDVFVAKLNATGTALLYSTYLGGSAVDFGWAIAIDGAGNAYVTGQTWGTFPTTAGAIQTTFGGGTSDAFVAKLNATGSALIYSTYLGGSNDDAGYGIAVDGSGNAYVTGEARPGFPTTAGAFQTQYADGDPTLPDNEADAFVAKLNPTGTALVYSTFLGGTDDDRGFAIAVDAIGNAYVTGETWHPYGTFPTTAGAFQTLPGGCCDALIYGRNRDAFVTKLNPEGSALVYSSLLGGDDSEVGRGIAVDASGNAHVTGWTWSFIVTPVPVKFPITPGAFHNEPTGPCCPLDVFVTKFNATGTGVFYSTRISGSLGQHVRGTGIALDSSGFVYVAAQAQAGFPTTAGAYQSAFGGGTYDGLVFKMDIIPHLDHFNVSAPGNAIAGSAFSYTVTAVDQFNNTITGYAGAVHFTSSDGQAVLPANATLTNGAGTFSATLKTAGTQTVVATDTVATAVTGSSNIAVSPLAATHLGVSAPTATAGIAFTFTVTALDPYNNTAPSYSGTVHFTSSDGQATLPANSTLSNGASTFPATLQTAGVQTITATDTMTPSITGTGNVTVSAAAATHFTLSAPANATAGGAFSVTLTAYDQFNNVTTGYTGTVQFTSTDASLGVVIPADYTFLAGDQGVHTFPGITLVTAGIQALTATDPTNNLSAGANITVSAAAASIYTMSAPPNATAGNPFNITLTARDAWGNVTTGYLDTVHFTKTDAGAGSSIAPDYTFVAADNGVHVFTNGVTLVTVGKQTLTATDTANSAMRGSAQIIVGAAAATQLTAQAPAAATAGSAFNVTLMARDTYGNVAPGYRGTVHFTKTDAGGGSGVPADYTFTAGDNGVHTFTNGVTLVTAGAQTITATDTANGSITASANVTVNAAAATHFTLSAPASTTAGSSFSATVTALDPFGNITTAYRGTVHFSKTDAGAASGVPADYTFTAGDNGVHAFTNGVTLVSAGTQTLTVTDTVNASITGSATVSVGPAAATQLTAQAPATATAGSAFNVTLTARDAYGNVVPGYRDTVHFTKTDAGGGSGVPSDDTFTAGDNGVHTFTNGVTLVTAGVQTITATDMANGSITASANVTVNAAAATHFTLSAPASTTAGSSFSATVTALDPFGNITTAYRGTVHFSKTDAGAASGVPADYTFTAGDNGVHAFTNGVTLVSAGTQTLTARDTANNSVTGNASVLVNAAATIQFGVSAPALVIGGSAFTFTVSALDAYSNITPAYAGTVHFTSSDGQASLPGNATLANGNGTFQATLATHGNQALLATDAGNVSITGSTSIAVAVKSYTAPSATGTGPITASFTGGGAACSFSQAQFLPPPPGTGLVPPSSPAGNYNFPHGLFVFKTTGCTPGSTIVVTIIYPTAASGLYSYWKYGPEPQIPGDHWYIMQAAINGNVVIFPITDGSRGDDDLQPNGDIVDQGGLAYFAPMIVPALSPWLLAVLALMLAVFTGQVTRRAVVVGKDESAR